MNEEEVNALIAEKLADKEAEIERLKSKNNELIGKTKKLKEESDTAKTAREQAEEDAARKDGDIAKLEKTLETKYAKTISELTAERDNLISSNRKALVDNAIKTALASNNVLPEAQDLIETYFSTRVEHGEDGPVVDGKPIGDALTEYFKSDKAKHFIAASGTGGVGPKLHAGKATASPTDAWSIDAYVKLKATDPAAAASWATTSGNGYLNDI